MSANNNRLIKRIFIWEFVWSEELIRHIIRLCEEKGLKICGWAVRRKDINRIIEVWPDAPIFEAPLPTDLHMIDYKADVFRSFSFEEEENIRFLLDREGGYQNNMHSSQVRYEVYGWVQTLLNRTKPDWILFPDVPHNIFTYLLYLYGKRQGIQTQMIRYGFPPHLLTISESIERESWKTSLKTEDIKLSSQTTEYLNTLRHDDAQQPIYMIKQKKNVKPIQIMKRLISKGSDVFTKKSLDAAFTYKKRTELKKIYENLCNSKLKFPKSDPYVVVFLHLQPERTTMPEGGLFAQQWLMVQMLSEVCSAEGYKIYVKEHPSTFMAGPKLYRGRWFYDSLKVLPNVSFVSTSVNSSVILKNAKAVATITGTVGLEAVVKGIPALIFGESVINGCAGTYRIRKLSDLETAISSIKKGIELEFDDIKRFFSDLEHHQNTHNTGLARTADHGDLWLQGVPQEVMFSKMVAHIEKEVFTSIENEN